MTVVSTDSTPTGCVLVIDNESTHAIAVKAMSQRDGYDAVVTMRSVEALELFRSAPKRYGVVVTNATMPGMTDEEMVQVLRATRPDVPIIMCTDFSHPVDIERVLMLGIDVFLLKPLARMHLATTIAQILNKRTEQKPETAPGR